MNIPIYVINFNDEERRNSMIKRFETIGLKLRFTPPVYKTDPRLNIDIDDNRVEKRTWSIQLQHLDSIRDFYENTNQDYCIVCEDDILISKNFNKDMEQIIENFNKLELDILLLGYLLPFKLQNDYFKLKKTIGYTINEYPDDLWGSQMYLITRKYAKFLLDKYTIEFAVKNLDLPYSPDWTITKNGNRALLYPMIALEEGSTKTDHIGQNNFHRNCFLSNYDKDIFI